MPKILYVDKRIGKDRLLVIIKANEIIDEYRRQGYDLTLRQLYYQFVSRDIIPNKVSEYKKLGDIISDGRRCGLIDWNAIVDRTRNLRIMPSWKSPQDIVSACASEFHMNRWNSQDFRLECWFEKDALAGVFQRPCQTWDVPYFSCRGYTSDSEIWGAAQRFISNHKLGLRTVVLHFGDHDPSGMDMTRDIEDRLRLFGARMFEVRRLALNMDQVEAYGPPPNPAKETDARFAGYRDLYGDQSWELDALEPSVLSDLVEQSVRGYIDEEAWGAVEDQERQARELLERVADQWDDVREFLGPDLD